jgi:uncharacterized protein YebE (UPF0316 family)
MFDFLDTYPWLLPFIIFFARIVDVSLGTLRIIFVSKGEKYKAPLIGFFEVFIWIVVISQVFARANSMIAYISYAAGYATGNFVGILIEQKIAFGILLVRAYTQKGGKQLVALLHDNGFGATMFHGTGSMAETDIVETVIERKSLSDIHKILSEFDKDIFYVAEDVRTKKSGVFPETASFFARWRMGK